MKTVNTIYDNFEALKSVVTSNNINEYSEILIQVYTSIHTKETIDALIKELLCLMPNANIIGASTKDVIYHGELLRDSCIISISVFNNTKISVGCYDKYCTQSEEIGQEVASSLCDENSKVMITFINNDELNISKYLSGIKEVNPQVVIAGGLASNNGNGRFVFNNHNIISEGLVAASLNNRDLQVFSDYNSGWIPIGNSQEVTLAEEKVIYEVEGIAAKEWYSKYLGKDNLKKDNNLGLYFPILVKKDNTYIVKAVYYDEGQDYLRVPSGMNTGDKIRLGFGDINNAVESIKRVYERIINTPIESIFAFSCDSRKIVLKNCCNWELSPFKGTDNLVGFFTLGELLHNNENNYLMNEVCSFLGLSESPDAFIKINKAVLKNITSLKEDEQTALDYLIKSTNEELNEMNRSLLIKLMDQTEKLKKSLYIDELTELKNMNKYKFDIKEIKYNKIALFDIQDFAQINNLYGNEVGNRVIKDFSAFLRDYANKNDLKAYRINIDIFALTGGNSIEEFHFLYLIRELQEEINRTTFKMDFHEVYLNVSVSVVVNEDKLIEKANLTLDYLKRKKKNIQIYHQDLRIEEEIENNLLWIRKIKKAIVEDRVVTYFQPIYNNKTQIHDKYEVLIRIIDEDGKVITPFHFLDIAKKANLYKQLTKIVINKAFAVFENKHYSFSINITVDDILDTKTKNYILYKLSTFSKPQNVIFELVETEGIESYSEVKNFIEQVKKYGAKIAIDDFGTGYSNLAYLTQIDIDILKIDGSIIRKLNDDESSNIIAKTVLYLTKSLGISTVAEYVENESIYTKVRELDIDYSQGYYFSEPLSEII